MLLGTYQPKDWETSKEHSGSRIKSLLGVEDTEKLFWCFPANNVEQALINSICCEPKTPYYFILFEADLKDCKYIDKHEWNMFVKAGQEENADIRILDESEYPVFEVVTTKIPENRFQICTDMHDFMSRYPSKIRRFTPNQSRAIKNCTDIAFLQHAQNCPDIVKDALSSVSEDDQTARGNIIKACFEAHLFRPIYRMAQGFVQDKIPDITESDPFRPFVVPSQVIKFHEKYASLYNDDTTFMKAYYSLASDIYLSFFEGTRRNFGRKIGANEPCPCGSGKKYKRCCALTPVIPNIEDILTSR